MTQFLAPHESFADVSAEAVAALVASSGDLALVLDVGGVIRDVAYGNQDLARDLGDHWIGRSWRDTVTGESRIKIESMLQDANSRRPPRWRQVNHPVVGDAEAPVQYIVGRVGDGGRLVAIGRDLRSVSALQQRLIAAQQSIDREHARLRQTEMRYRLLFEATPEAVLIVDGATLKVSEANPSAVALLAPLVSRLIGRSVLEAFDPTGADALQTLLASVRVTGRGAETRALGIDGATTLRVAAAVFRYEGAAFFLVRIVPEEPDAPPAAAADVFDMFARLPEGLVRTDAEGAILEANPAFLDLVQANGREQVVGQSLDRWLGRPGVDLSVLIANLRQNGAVRLYATKLRGEYGDAIDVEVSAAMLPGGERPGIGFLVHNVGRRIAAERGRTELPHSVAQLKELVGRVPLKDLVRETTDVAEQLCIEAALELTGDNRASAAEILGLSRQSLYVKLRRYGMGDSEPDAE